MDFLSYRCTSIEVIEGKPTLVWKWSSDPDWYSKIEPMRLVEKRRAQRRKKGLPPEPIPTSPLREMALYNRQQQYPDAVAACVEINQCVGCTRHRHAVEQASRRWRGGRRTRRELLISTQVEAPAPSKKLSLKEAAKAAKNAVKARKNQQRRKARRSWDLEQEEKSRMQARADADASYLEAERLRLSCGELIWLNPLLRFAAFEPRAAGVKALLPEVSRHLPVHDLDSVQRLVHCVGEMASLA